KQYGPVMSVRMGRQDWVVLGDYETIQQGLVKHGNAFSGRPSIATIDQITEGHGVLFIDYNDHWKRQRRFGLSTLRGFGVGKRSMEDRITEEVAYLNDAIRTHDGKAFDIQSILSNAVSNNICSIVMGRRFDYDDERFKEIMGRLARGYITLLSDTQLLQYVRDLFVAGTETTTSTVRWSLLCLIHNPETQEKLRKEIFEVLGTQFSFENKSKMPYTSAFIQEIYRYRTLVPLSVTHMTNEDAHISGYTIPKGTTIAPNLWAVHNDPEEWDEPNKFKPERHLDAGGNFVQLKHVIPFSVGPRHCLGEQLARMEVFIFLVSLVQKFEFLPDPKAT
uniref:Uncharacterized protein n=1 Tax=Ciona savignyi TaxID=51511 RepID=H2Z9F6_CIOSA